MCILRCKYEESRIVINGWQGIRVCEWAKAKSNYENYIKKMV